MMGAVVIQARRTVRRTPELLPQLREAGVEDAGAKGFLYVLQGIREAVANRVSKVTDMNPAVIPQPITDTSGTGGRIWGYDLQFLIYGKGMPLDAIRARIEMMGESVLVVGDEELLRVHLHTHEPEAVLEYARTAGNVDNISCQDMDSQVAEHQKKVSAKRI
jgi:dihydroxyacetone kinase-like predicted kinase